MFFLLPLGVSGLVLSDLKPHLYEGADEVLLPAGMSLVEDPMSSGTYRIGGLPDLTPFVVRRTLTVEYPEGVGYSFVWGGEQTGTPIAMVLPVREADLVTGDFTFSVYKNGVSQNGVTITVGDSLQPYGDYPVFGWPIESNGDEWLVVWSRAGSEVYNFFGWKELSLASSGFVISCSALHPPYDIGTDDTLRSYFSCNYALKLDGLFRFDRAFAKYLESEGFGTVNDNPNLMTGTIFYGRTVTYPTEGQVILLIPQSGYSSLKTNDNGLITRPVLQVLVFDPDRDTAQLVSNQIFQKLDLLSNTTLSVD